MRFISKSENIRLILTSLISLMITPIDVPPSSSSLHGSDAYLVMRYRGTVAKISNKKLPLLMYLDAMVAWSTYELSFPSSGRRKKRKMISRVKKIVQTFSVLKIKLLQISNSIAAKYIEEKQL